MLSSLSLSVDDRGDVLVSGAFVGTLSLGRKTLEQRGSAPQLFLAKFSSAGELLWSSCEGPTGCLEPVAGRAAGQPEARRGSAAPAADGAFSWLESSVAAPGVEADPSPTVESPTIEPPLPQLPPVASPNAEAAGSEPDRDSFEPVWLAEPAQSVPSDAEPHGAWRGRLARGLGYSLGAAGAASALGVLMLALLQPPAGDLGAAAALAPPTEVGSLESHRVTVDLPPPPGPESDEQIAARLGDGVVPSGSPAELRAKTLELLGRRDAATALPWARALVAADPTHALSYLCLGAALIDLGRRPEARQAFSQCVRTAERGDVAECAALGGRRE
ncbi:MAG: bacterial transcriptional activator domain-containing protein [Deltaproteobacteria bacterium]|jgi:hypothetical protein|nr:bacterial transcriptional activator domain-containing protein [Deltaproteobacteria bacterium]MBW2537780.1 bacterial transcriptional activator domain-containing protein [Deltaproteobacteria bacterium]